MTNDFLLTLDVLPLPDALPLPECLEKSPTYLEWVRSGQPILPFFKAKVVWLGLIDDDLDTGLSIVGIMCLLIDRLESSRPRPVENTEDVGDV